MKKTRKLVILGASAFAEIAYEYFQYDSEYAVVGFAVEEKFIEKSQMFNLPIVPFERIQEYFAPGDVYFFAAFVYTQFNRLRARFYHEAKNKGYKAASYVSSRSFVWRNVVLGEHVFIFEDNTIQPFVKIGNNVVLWSGNHIGHHSKIGDHCFVASHAVISGFCDIGEWSFLGVNATLVNNITISKDTLIGAGALVAKSVADDDLIIKGKVGEAVKGAKKFFKMQGA